MTTLADHERALLNSFAGARAKWLVWNMALAAALKWLENDVLVERSSFTVSDAGRAAATRAGQRL
jgi:hypothetical protein